MDRVHATDFSGRVYRHLTPGRDCSSGEGARAAGGRWNPPQSYPTLYTSLTQHGAYSELALRAKIQKVPVEALLPRVLCVLKVELIRVLDITSPDALTKVGLSTESIGDPNRASCQAVGEAAYRLGFEGILAPSAASDGINLAIYPLNLASPLSSIAQAGAISWATIKDLRGNLP